MENMLGMASSIEGWRVRELQVVELWAEKLRPTKIKRSRIRTRE